MGTTKSGGGDRVAAGAERGDDDGEGREGEEDDTDGSAHTQPCASGSVFPGLAPGVSRGSGEEIGDADGDVRQAQGSECRIAAEDRGQGCGMPDDAAAWVPLGVRLGGGLWCPCPEGPARQGHAP